MLEYAFERVDCTGSGGYSFLGGVGNGLASDGGLRAGSRPLIGQAAL